MSMTGVFAILLEHRPHPGPAAIWLFIAGAALGFSIVVRASGAHRASDALQPASGYQLFNLSPVAVVPAVSLIVWWIPLGPFRPGAAWWLTRLLAVAWGSAHRGGSCPVRRPA